MKDLFQRHPKLVSALTLTSVIALFFAVKFIVGVVYWSQHQQEAIRPWMTAGYIGKSWGINPRELDRQAGLPPPTDHPYTLAEAAKQRGIPVEELIKQVEATIAKMKAEQK